MLCTLDIMKIVRKYIFYFVPEILCWVSHSPIVKRKNKVQYCDPVTIKLRFLLTVTEINYNYRLNIKKRIVMKT